MKSENTCQALEAREAPKPAKRKPMLLEETGSWEVGPEEVKKFMDRVEKSDSCWGVKKGFRTQWGHVQWSVKVNGKRSTILAHRLVYFIERGPIPQGMLVLHNCPGGDNPGCVNPEHMFLGTDAHNNQDKERKGTGNHPRGQSHGRTKITEDQVREAIKLRREGWSNQRVANRLGVSVSCIAKIHSGLNWTHISSEYGIESRDQRKYRKMVALDTELPPLLT